MLGQVNVTWVVLQALSAPEVTAIFTGGNSLNSSRNVIILVVT